MQSAVDGDVGHLENYTGAPTTLLLNFSGQPPKDEDISELWTTSSKVAVGILLTLVIITSICGNVLVCIAIYSARRLRTLGNVFLGSLAVADLFVTILVETFAIVNDLKGEWIFGRAFCEVWIAFDVMCCTASILNLCAISLDRFIHIKDPMKYNRLVTKRVVCLAVAAIWLLSVLLSFVPVTLGWHGPPMDDNQCFMDLTPTYAVVSSSISFFLPSIVMVTLYYKLYAHASMHVRNIRAITRIHARTTRSGSTTSSAAYLWKHSSDRKAAITLGIIMGTFLVCWFPFFCINITVAFCKTCVSKFTFMCFTWLGYLNSAFNPIIYSIFNVEFRKAFRHVFVTYCRSHCCLSDNLGRRDSGSSGSRWSNGRRKSPVLNSSEMATAKSSLTSESTAMITTI